MIKLENSVFVIVITYQKPLAEVDKYLAAHRDFLSGGYEKNYFICSGPQNPRSGGVIISQLNDRKQLENFLKDDPFLINQIASYQIIEFTPVKYHADFSEFIN